MRCIKAINTRVSWFFLAALLCMPLLASKSAAQAITEDIKSFDSLPPVLTHAPLDTLQSLQKLHDALIAAYVRYQNDKTRQNYTRINLITDALISLLDLSTENLADRRDVSIRTAMALIDIIEEVETTEFASVPDRDSVLLNPQEYHPVPGTPLLLQRVDDGPREGEFLFSSNSTKIAPRFVREIAMHSPSRLDDLWSTRLLGISGPMIPAAFEQALPDFLRDIYWGTSLWKIVATAICFSAAITALVGVNKLLNRRVAGGHIRRSTRNLILSASTLCVLHLLNHFFDYQLFLTGSFARRETFFATLAISLALAWTFWSFMNVVSDTLAQRSSSTGIHYDESMMRLSNHIIGLVGAVWILAYGAQSLGFPLLSILAGLGVGGLAVALAIRPTLENLISGFVLYLEKSVRVGDYCSFSGRAGTVESIGVRSTHVRALDRTLIAIPNSKFVDMELVNWARCDEMLIHSTIGLRYETDTEQLRYVLAEIRSMMYGHPRINSDTARIRFVGYGSSSLDIDVRVYAQSREWNDFYAIREDVMLRIKEIVEASGTGFAFPSQTVYFTKDTGLDETKSGQSIEKVRRWRRNRELPFPNFSPKYRERMENSLRYPPPGSPEFNGPDEELAAVEERLSAEDLMPDDEAEETAHADAEPDDRDKNT